MNIKHSLIAILLLMLFSLVACEDKTSDNDDDQGDGGSKVLTEVQKMNEDIYDEMKLKYFWNAEIPSSTSLDFNKEPNDFFYSILYKYKQSGGDMFSYLEKDGITYYVGESASLGEASHNDIGFEFYLVPLDKSNNPPVQICVSYIKKNSDVEKQNKLKRGDFITAIDGTSLTKENCLDLIFSGKPTLSVQIAGQKEPIEIKATPVFYESPVLLDTIYTVGSKQVGYIIYNFFGKGKTEDSYEYALEMNEVLQNFKTKKIDELILDLRYNGGGYVLSGTYIASAIVPKRAGKIYSQRQYNDLLEQITDYKNNKKNPFVDKIQSKPIPQLEMTRLYVITSTNTASASEQIINGLRAHNVDVRIVGEKTTGKNMESFPIDIDAEDDSKWVLHPLTAVSYNGVVQKAEDNDYSEGFYPTLPSYKEELSELNLYMDRNGLIYDPELYNLGDRRERLLSIVLNDIAPTTRSQRSLVEPMDEQGGTRIFPIGSSFEKKRNDMIIESYE